MNILPEPQDITLPEECPVCRWCGQPISPTKPSVELLPGELYHDYSCDFTV